MHIIFEDPENFFFLHKRVRNLQSYVSYFTVTEAIPMKTLPSILSTGFRGLNSAGPDRDACSRLEAIWEMKPR